MNGRDKDGSTTPGAKCVASTRYDPTSELHRAPSTAHRPTHRHTDTPTHTAPTPAPVPTPVRTTHPHPAPVPARTLRRRPLPRKLVLIRRGPLGPSKHPLAGRARVKSLALSLSLDRASSPSKPLSLSLNAIERFRRLWRRLEPALVHDDRQPSMSMLCLATKPVPSSSRMINLYAIAVAVRC
jgi:hypothetical protein